MAMVQNFWNYATLFVPDGYNVREPAALAILPVYEKAVDQIRMEVNADDDNDNEPVAYLTFSFFFKELIRDILPENSQGVHVVVDSDCGGSFTYRLDGRETFFLVRT